MADGAGERAGKGTVEGAVDLQPTLRGALLELRPVVPEDFDALFAVASDREIWVQHPEPDRYTDEVFRRFFAGALASGGALVAIDRASGQIVGSSRFAEFDAERRELEIGWSFLARTHWGGQFNGEMKSLMLRHALGFVDRVRFVIGPDNVRSRRAIERVGGVLRGLESVRGQENAVYVIEKTHPRFAVSPVEGVA